MTLDHASHPVGPAFRGLMGEMPGPLAAPGGAAPPLTLNLDPGTATLQFAVTLPDRNWAGRRAGPFTVIRCPSWLADASAVIG